MKILHLVQKPQLRGAEMFASQLSTHFEKKGVDALMVFLYPGNSDLPFEGKKYFLNRPQRKKFFDFLGWKKIAEIIKNERPDIIQANAGDTLKYAIFSKIFFRWKQPVVFRNASTISLYIKGKLMQRFNAFFFKRTDKVISVSKKSADDFIQLFPTEASKVEVIPIGIETVSHAGTDLEKTPVQKLSGNPAILHVGGFSFEKNHKRLLAIFKNVLKEKPEAILHLVGDGHLKIEIENEVEKLELKNQVVFYGFRKNAMDFMQNADVLVLPSIIEGLPGVILEAFFSKLSVVAYNVGGIPEILINEETGFLVTKDNDSEFVEKIIEATPISEKSKKMQRNAYDLVSSQYLNDKIAVKFIDAYNKLISIA